MKTEPVESDMQILRTGSCASLSGKSKLKYEVGCNASSKIHLRISKSFGTGFFGKEWVSWDRLQRLLDKNGNKPITSHTLAPLFTGRSVNTAGFVLAALIQEGLVEASAEKRRCYQRLDGTAFLAELQGLMETGKASSSATPGGVKKASSARRAPKA